MPTLKEQGDLLFDQVLSVKKWQEEKLENMRRTQAAYRARFDADNKQIDQLLIDNYNLRMRANKAKADMCASDETKRSEPAALVKPVTTCQETTVERKKQELDLITKPKLMFLEPTVQQAEPVVSNTAQRESKNLTHVKEKSDLIATAASKTVSLAPTIDFDEVVVDSASKQAVPEALQETCITTVKPKMKRPFLKKRSGLQRFTPSFAAQKQKRKKAVENVSKPEEAVPEKNPVQPALRSSDTLPKGLNVHFRLPGEVIQASAEEPCPEISPSVQGKKADNVAIHPEASHSNFFIDEKEAKELAEFEILESAVENSALNNLETMTGLLDGKGENEKSLDESEEFVDRSQLLELIKKLNSEKIRIQKDLEECNKDCDSDSVQGIIEGLNVSPPQVANNRFQEISRGKAPNTDSVSKADEVICSRLTVLLNEQRKELAAYKAKNAELEEAIRQKAEELANAVERHVEFERAVEEKQKKIDAEKKMQMKREKQSFEHQKARYNMPSRKERDEINELKQQVASLQEELRKQNVKSSAECRRLRRLLSAAEKERDCLKVENERLQAQLSDSVPKSKNKPTAGQIQAKSRPSRASGRLVRPSASSIENLASADEHFDNSQERDRESEGAQLAALARERHHVNFDLEPTICTDGDGAEYREIEHLGKKERTYRDGRKEIHHTNGTVEHISSDGRSKKFVFYNGDIKEFFPDGKTTYHYKDGTVQNMYPDGLEVFEYSNHQVDKIYPDGTKKVTFPTGHSIVTYTDGMVEQQYVDGTVLKALPDGTETIEYPSGDKEWRTEDYVKHLYANGIVKTIYKSGRTETCFPDGQLKVTDKEGRVILDTTK